MMDLISIRLPREMVERLRVLARHEAVRRNATVTWSGLVREAIEAWLVAESGLEGGPPSCKCGAG